MRCVTVVPGERVSIKTETQHVSSEDQKTF